MKKLLTISALLLLIAVQVSAQTQGQNLPYIPLEPIVGVTTGANEQAISFPTLLKNLFNILLTLGALFSVTMLTVSGIRYMLSDVVTSKEKALKRITACLWGLLLIAGSWLILYTINPQLLNFTLNPCPNNNCVITGSTGATSQSQTQTFTSSGANTSLDGVTVNQENCNVIKDAAQGFWSAGSYDGMMLALRSNLRSVFTDMTQAQAQQASQNFLAACAEAKLI